MPEVLDLWMAGGLAVLGLIVGFVVGVVVVSKVIDWDRDRAIWERDRDTGVIRRL